MNPSEAYNILVNCARQLKLTAAEHDQITQAALTIKPIIEKHEADNPKNIAFGMDSAMETTTGSGMNQKHGN